MTRLFSVFRNAFLKRPIAQRLHLELVRFNKVRYMCSKSPTSEFEFLLTDEIKTTRAEYDTTMVPPEGWTMTEYGSVVEMQTITPARERIVVKFDVSENYDINRDEPDDSTQRYPLLNISFEKPNKPKLSLKVIFDPDANDWDLGMLQLKNGVSVIISSFTVGCGDFEYSCSEDYADPEILMRLSDYMISKGLNADFFQEIVEHSDNFDLKNYGNLLSNLREFIIDKPTN